jgi:hypothetical protein
VHVQRLLPLILILYTIPDIALSSQSTPPLFDLEAQEFSALESSSEVGHTFRTDLYRQARSNTELLLIIPGDQIHQFLPLFQNPGLREHASILIPAPRRDSGDTITLIQQLSLPWNNTAVVFLDAHGDPGWYAAVPYSVSPFWVVEMVIQQSDIPLAATELTASRLGFGREDQDMSNALAAGLSAIRLKGATSQEAITDLVAITTHRIVPDHGGQSHSLNYLILPGGQRILVTEPLLVSQYILLTALLLSYGLFRPAKFRRFRRALGYNTIAILISFLLLVISLIVGNLVIRLVQHILPPDSAALLLVSGKVSLAILTLGVLAITVQRKTRRVAAVFSGAAVVLLFVGAITIASVSVVVGMYLVISFIFAIFFSLSRRVAIKGICFVFSLAPLLYISGTLVSLNDLPVLTRLLTPQLYQEVVTAIILLPALLMLFRLDSLTPRIPLVPIMTMFATVGVALVAAFIINLRQGEPRNELLLHHHYIVNAGAPVHGRMYLTGSADADAGQPYRVTIPGYQTMSCTTLPCHIEFSPPPGADQQPVLDGRVEITSAMDRHTISWAIKAAVPLKDAQIRFTLPREVQLYASDIPARQPPGHRGTVFHLDNGPLPPKEFGGTIVFRAPEAPALVDTYITAQVQQSSAVVFPTPDEILVTEEWSLTIGGAP